MAGLVTIARGSLTLPLGVATLVLAAYLLFGEAAKSFSPPGADQPASQLTVTDWNIRERDDPGLYDVASALDLPAAAGTSRVNLLISSAANSLWLVVLAEVISVSVGVPLGLVLALRRTRSLAAIGVVVGVFAVVPGFFGAFMLQVLAVELGAAVGRTVFPVFGFGIDSHLLIPVLALAVAPAALVARLMSAHAAAVADEDYVRTARAKGLAERDVVRFHILPNLGAATVASALNALELVLASLLIVEYLVVWPGVGWLALRALRAQDLPTLLPALVILGSAVLVVHAVLGGLYRGDGN